MSLSRADVKCLTLKSLWGWKGWFEAEQALCGIKFAWRPSMTWIPPFLSLSPFSSLYASHFSAFAYKKMLLFQRTLFFSLSYSFTLFSFSFSFSFSNDALWHGRITCYQVIMVDESESLHRRIEDLSWKKKRWTKRFVFFEFVNSFLVIISKRIIEIFIIDFWWNLDWNIFQILRGDFFLKRIVRIFHFP